MTEGRRRRDGPGERAPASEREDVGSAAVGPARAEASASIAGHAALIAGLTVASRVAGFGRILVFTWAVGISQLGDLYQAANTVPNIVFEIVAGGALASLVVPVVAAPLLRGDRDVVAATASGLLTWTVGLLVPVAVVLALAAEPVITGLVGDPTPAELAVGADMLRLFAPQLPLYGIGLVLAGLLQAHRRFVWPVLAPLLSSVTVSIAYLWFATAVGRRPDVAGIGTSGLLILAGGTTVAVAVLTLSLALPVRRLGLRLRPTFRLGDVAGPVRRLAAAGAVTVGAQQACLALVIVLAKRGPDGSVVLYTLAQTMFLLPWAVLAVPIATSAFPVLAEREAADDRAGFAATAASAVRGTLLVTTFGAAVLAAVAPDAAEVLAGLDSRGADPAPLAAAIVAFAPGLIGYGLFAVLSRVLYARHASGAAAGATFIGWAAVATASLVVSALWQPADRVSALAAANSVGMTVLGAALLVMSYRRAAAGVLAGAGRAIVVAGIAGVAGVAAALAARTIVPDRPGLLPALGQGALSVVLVVGVFGAVAYAADRRDVRPAVTALARRLRRGRVTQRR
jgi:putative peptidoglycan lipid II flippase